VITGAYTGRLYFATFHGKEGEAAHHAAHHKGHLQGFDLPLIPLALGAVLLGYLEAGTHGLSSMLAGVVAKPLEVHLLPTGLGILAFALGAVGFGLGIVLARTPKKGLPVFGSDLADGLWGEVDQLPRAFASLHAGQVGRYLIISLIGAMLMGGLALRPVFLGAPVVAPKAAGEKSDAKKRDGKKRDDKKRDGKRDEARRGGKGDDDGKGAARSRSRPAVDPETGLPPADAEGQLAGPNSEQMRRLREAVKDGRLRLRTPGEKPAAANGDAP
jgi:hypothetical protein